MEFLRLLLFFKRPGLKYGCWLEIRKVQRRMSSFWILCRSCVETENHSDVCVSSSRLPASSLFVLVETAVNIGYACRLLDPDTRLLEWQELRSAMMKNINKSSQKLNPSHWSLFTYADRYSSHQTHRSVSSRPGRQMCGQHTLKELEPRLLWSSPDLSW